MTVVVGGGVAAERRLLVLDMEQRPSRDVPSRSVGQRAPTTACPRGDLRSVARRAGERSRRLDRATVGRSVGVRSPSGD
jgi:hypothetical protein